MGKDGRKHLFRLISLACMHACVCVCTCVRTRVRACMYVRACACVHFFNNINMLRILVFSLSSQYFPSKPGLHMHLNPPSNSSMHVAPFWQGLLRQGGGSCCFGESAAGVSEAVVGFGVVVVVVGKVVGFFVVVTDEIKRYRKLQIIVMQKCYKNRKNLFMCERSLCILSSEPCLCVKGRCVYYRVNLVYVWKVAVYIIEWTLFMCERSLCILSSEPCLCVKGRCVYYRVNLVYVWKVAVYIIEWTLFMCERSLCVLSSEPCFMCERSLCVLSSEPYLCVKDRCVYYRVNLVYAWKIVVCIIEWTLFMCERSLCVLSSEPC